MSVWLQDGGDDARERRPRLSRKRIIVAAVALLDAEGVPGFSMRRLAARLGAGTMSLYEYVSSKEHVLELALDAALGELDLPDVSGPSWRSVITTQMEQSRQVMRRHPWIPTLVGTRPLLGPNALVRSERIYTVLHRAGFTGPTLVAAVSAVTSYVHGYVVQELAWRNRYRDRAAETELRQQAQDYLNERAGLYPTLADQARLVEDADFDDGFALGLKLVLDGLEAQLDS